MKNGYCWLCGLMKKVKQVNVDGKMRWLCKKCEIINSEISDSIKKIGTKPLCAECALKKGIDLIDVH